MGREGDGGWDCGQTGRGEEGKVSTRNAGFKSSLSSGGPSLSRSIEAAAAQLWERADVSSPSHDSAAAVPVFALNVPTACLFQRKFGLRCSLSIVLSYNSVSFAITYCREC